MVTVVTVVMVYVRTFYGRMVTVMFGGGGGDRRKERNKLPMIMFVPSQLHDKDNLISLRITQNIAFVY